MDASDDDASDSDGTPPDEERNEVDESNEESEDDLVLLNEINSDEDEPAPSKEAKKRKSKNAERGPDTSFADASEYAELINKGWKEAMLTKKLTQLSGEETDLLDIPLSKHSSGGKKRKQRS
jgi:hypothetical protein